MSHATQAVPIIHGVDGKQVDTAIDDYLKFHDDTKNNKLDERNTKYTKMVNYYYDLATDFYEWGWGQSFHFANRVKTETFRQSISRHEHYLAYVMKLSKDNKVLDVGCGVGGPAREIARFAEVNVTGLNNNAYQVGRATLLTKRQGLEGRCNFVKSDFMHMPFEDNTFDAVYEIEATAHAPNKKDCYSEIWRVLKPGGVFASYEWCLTDKYDASNAHHVAIKKAIEEGDGLPDIATTDEVVTALKAAKFDVEVIDDRAATVAVNANHVPWYDPLEPRYTLLSCNIQHTSLGRTVGNYALQLGETLSVVPKGSAKVSAMLNRGAWGLYEGGKNGTFTPMFFTLARKPTTSTTTT